MRSIIIDIRPLLPKHSPGGVPEYTKELVRAMLGIIYAKKLAMNVFLFSSGIQKPNLEFLKIYKKCFYHIHLNTSNRILNTSFKFLNYPKIDTLVQELQVTSYKLQDSVFFAPNINVFPLSRQTGLVATFHDLSFERYPFFLKGKEKLWHQWVNPRAIAKKADKIIAVSESTKQDLMHIYGIEPSKIKVVYSGVRESQISNLKSQNHKSKFKTVLYLGSTEGRKNIESLKCAFNLVQKRLTNKKLKLIIAGPPHDPVTEKEKVEFYQNANLFIYPSIFEGFGFPPLEAMAMGVPVITSNTSSLPEAVGDSAIMVNPRRVYELAQALEALLTDEKLRAFYIKKGIEHVTQFTWEKAAGKTLDVLLSV